MKRSIAIAICLLGLTGCQSGKSVGINVADFIVSALLDDDEDRRRDRESRQAWRQATGGDWDGVQHSLEY